MRADRATRARTPCTACRATTSSSRCSATPTATAPAASPCSTRRRSRSRAAGRTAASARHSTTTSGTSRARTCSSRPSSASRTPTSPGSTSPTSRPGATGSASTSGTSRARGVEQTVDLGENGPRPARGALAARPGRRRGLRRRRAVEHDVALPPRRTAPGRRSQVIADRERRARGLAVPGPGPDHRPGALDGRPLPLPLQLAARRPAPVRRLRPGEPEADRPALARRRARQADRRRPRAERRPADAPALARRPTALRHELAPTRRGTTSSTRACARGCCASTVDPNGGMEIDRDFFVDFHDRPGGPARAHEMRLQGGDCTTEIFQ